MPILLAPECSIAISTLPALVRRHPTRACCGSTRTPTSTPRTRRAAATSRGMCLAGACGLWDTGFGAGLDPPRVIMHGVREVEGGERVAPGPRRRPPRRRPRAARRASRSSCTSTSTCWTRASSPRSFPVDGGLQAGRAARVPRRGLRCVHAPRRRDHVRGAGPRRARRRRDRAAAGVSAGHPSRRRDRLRARRRRVRARAAGLSGRRGRLAGRIVSRAAGRGSRRGHGQAHARARRARLRGRRGRAGRRDACAWSARRCG